MSLLSDTGSQVSVFWKLHEELSPTLFFHLSTSISWVAGRAIELAFLIILFHVTLTV